MNSAVSTKSQPGDTMMWFALAGCGALVLLAVTNQICQEVAVIPFLWILPLSLYLLSFVFCFSWERIYTRTLWLPLLAFSIAWVSYVLREGVEVSLGVQIGSYAWTLFVACMVCHGELVRLKPDPERLTTFYLSVAAGGALSGVFTVLVAPNLFLGYWELHLSVILVCLLVLIVLFRDQSSFFYDGRPAWAWIPIWIGFMAVVVSVGLEIRQTLGETIHVSRNFYGVLRVKEHRRNYPKYHAYSLMHGRIQHGFQWVDPAKSDFSTSYYGYPSGIGVALKHHPRRRSSVDETETLRIGVVGLGIGILATYGQIGDTIRFYEINPDVVRLAREYFTYMQRSSADIEVVVADARIALEQEWLSGLAQELDVLAIDAFNSDSIPVHLLTQECFRLYWQHLKPDGILAVHISNRYLDLSPVVRSSVLATSGENTEVLLIRDDGNVQMGTDESVWILATRNQEFTEKNEVRSAVTSWDRKDVTGYLWTDDFCNLVQVLARE